MCGIAGCVSEQSIDFQSILQLLFHRGPDAQTVYTENNVTLLHTRLAIQDIRNGAQPFHFQHYSIIFNGEIYNHITLRLYLSEFTFHTNSDTETLLYLFIKYQYQMFDFLDGMFAFCIFDKKKNELILARDRAGKKPLYYYHDLQEFLFSSELNVLKSMKQLAIDENAINCYLRAGFIYKPHTPFKMVFKLEAGSYLNLNIHTKQFQIKSYFNLLNFYEKEKSTLSLSHHLDQLETNLKKSVASRIMASDVEVGVFLSGGIDSGLIAAMAAQMKPNLKTFTVKFEGSYDESPLAKLTSEKYKMQHVELSISQNIKQDIEKILQNYGEPFMDSSAVPSFYVSREAARHVKVILGGDGADELFAGYRRYVPLANSFIRNLKIMSPLLKLLPKPRKKQLKYNYLYRLLAMSKKTGLDFYLSSTTDIYEDVLTIPKDALLSQFNNDIYSIEQNHVLSQLNKLLYLDFNALLFSDLLVKMDIASMANSLEVRSPFLSKYMLEFAPTLPDQHKINRLTTKFILRKLAEKYLSPKLINQPKRGFEVPLKKWVNDDLKDNIFDRLTPGCYAENFIDRAFIQNVKNKKITIPAEKRAKILWSLYCLEVWHVSI